jgi:hypothetical protein
MKQKDAHDAALHLSAKPAVSINAIVLLLP